MFGTQQISSSKIGGGSVITSKLGNEAVTEEKLDPAVVAQLADHQHNVLTQAAYDALSSYDATTIYLVS